MYIAPLQYISQAAAGGTHLAAIEKVLRAGGKWIQLRMKDCSAAEVLQQAMAAKAVCDRYQAKLIINDFPGVALACGAYGVHLGLDDMAVPEARAMLGRGICIGGTANTFEQMRSRAAEGVDYIGLGPFRFTTTKKNLSPVLGLAGYTKLMEQARAAGITVPVLAIGGIAAADINPLLATGIHGIAVSGLLSHDPERILNQHFNQAHLNQAHLKQENI